MNHSPVIDTNGDGEIQVSEAEATSYVYLEHKGINSLEGIQSFVNLENLNCHGNQLTVLDISQNLNLKTLRCSWNQLTSIDISQHLNLESLVCYHNGLTNLDVTQNPNLEELWVSINPLTTLDVTQNPNLKELKCNSTELTNLNVSQNQNLERLSISFTELTSIDISNNYNLKDLSCSNVQLTSLDMSNNPNIISLTCRNTPLVSINIKNGNNINMPYMDARDNPSLECIQVDDVATTNARGCYPYDPMVGWCKDATATFSEECIMGVEEVDTATFSLYPNPVSDILSIEAVEGPVQVQIFSTSGVLIKATSNPHIDVSDLASGLYFAKVVVHGRYSTKKFLKI